MLEFVVLIGALLMGAPAGGVAPGLWGAVGLLVLVLGSGFELLITKVFFPQTH